MRRFDANQQSDPRFCHELLRRAFDDHDQEAANHVFLLYAPRLRRWLRRKIESDTVDDIVQETFTRLVDQSQRGSFVVAPYALSQVLWFIKRCALIVLKEQRDHLTTSALDPQDLPTNPLDLQLELASLATRLQQVLTPDEWATLERQYVPHQITDERVLRRILLEALVIFLRRSLPTDEWELLEMRYIKEMKPAAIAQQQGVEVEPLYLKLASLMRRLRNNADLKHLLEDI